MSFCKFDIPKIERIDSDSGRVYRVPSGELYPSITSILSKIPNPGIDAWKERVGEVQAKIISVTATRKGTLVHEAAENYLLNKPYSFAPIQRDAREMFDHLKPTLARISDLHALETQMWSDKLKVAGTVDCIGRFDDEMCIIDFKTSSRYKSRSDIESYFMQCAAYAVMFWERTGVLIPNIQILMANPEGVQIFDETVQPWIPKFLAIRNL